MAKWRVLSPSDVNFCRVCGVTCRPGNSVPARRNAWNPLPEVYIDMNTTPGTVAPARYWALPVVVFFSWACVFSGSKAERTIWFNNQTPTTIKYT